MHDVVDAINRLLEFHGHGAHDVVYVCGMAKVDISPKLDLKDFEANDNISRPNKDSHI